MRTTVLAILFMGITTLFSQEKTIYDFKVETITGDSISLSNFKGKKVMIVNTASECGFTPQYEQLQAIYEKYKDKGFVILGFPSNDFMHQEPGSNKEIAEFCKKNYGVTFPMMAKIHVKKNDVSPLYQYLTTGKQNGYKDTKIKWNFQKYLIGRDGVLERVYYSKTVPNDPKIIEWIEN